MAITKNLNFTKSQLKRFARLFKSARAQAGLTQLEVASRAFGYKISHCKVSRVERAVMPKVDAHCLEAMATTLNVPTKELLAIDPKFRDRAVVVREATRRGFWIPGQREVVPDRCAF